MPKKIVRFVRVFVDDPHITSWAAAVMLRRQLKELDETMNWRNWCMYRDKVVSSVIEAKIDLTCEFCGRPNLIPFTKKACENMLTLDHFVPHSKSKNNSTSNLVLSCRKCNSMKSDRMPTAEEISNVRTIEFLLNSAGQLKTI